MPARILAPFLLASLAAGAVSAAAAPYAAPAIAVATPADIFGPLYRAVELEHVFADSKTFADAVPRRNAGAILADFTKRKPTGAALRAFVAANFAIPATPAPPPPAAGSARTPLFRHIADLWPVLTRQPQAVPPGGSALPLPAPYVVPGGRFREIYYWDSYFTMLGLARDGRADLIEAMLDDFTVLIERYGHIPNGTRSYYLSRSQPPVYYLMLSLSQTRDRTLFRRRLAALRREHAWWMAGEAGLGRGRATGHVVRLPDGRLLNRYWDARETPRDESYAEDVATARVAVGRPPATLWRELRAGAESGWDYSSRWLTDPARLATIRTTSLAPVDLNALLYGMEGAIADACRRTRDTACVRDYAARAEARGAAIRATMWNPALGAFADIDWRTGRTTGLLTAATAMPLYTGAASAAQARTTARTIQTRLLAPGGLRTTLVRTGQQWDRPNGWAPLQWIAVKGLARYGETALARTLATRWIATVEAGYRATGTLVEKYDVEAGSAGAGGGEYANQLGFGWTNGVTRALIADYPPAR